MDHNSIRVDDEARGSDRRRAGWVAVAALLLTLPGLQMPASGAAQARRGIPRAIRHALVGCWIPWAGERWEFRRRGATGLRLRTQLSIAPLRSLFNTRLGSGTRRSSSTVLWTHRHAQIDCGPRTQHGQFCDVLPAEDDTLQVGVYGRGHGAHHSQGRLSFTATARRCAQARADQR